MGNDNNNDDPDNGGNSEDDIDDDGDGYEGREKCEEVQEERQIWGLQFNGDYLPLKKFIANLPSAAWQAKKRQQTIPHAWSWE